MEDSHQKQILDRLFFADMRDELRKQQMQIEDPGLFFVLRGVDRNELFEGDLAAALPPEAADLDAAAVGDAFGIDLDTL